MRPITACACTLLLLLLFGTAGPAQSDPGPAAAPADAAGANSLPGGELRAVAPGGEVLQFPLKHTEVHAEITGSVAQVRVEQIFQNPTDRPIYETKTRLRRQLQRHVSPCPIHQRALIVDRTGLLMLHEGVWT